MLYTLGRVNDEAEITNRRIGRQAATEAVLLQAAAGAVMTKGGGDHFQSLLKRVLGEE